MSSPDTPFIAKKTALDLFDTAIRMSDEGDGDPWSDSLADETGRRFGHFELLEEIARGGMGVVYRARQRDAQRVVALKMILPQQLSAQGVVERFRAEAEAVASLDHPAILPIYEVGERNGIPYFSMKFAEGGSLAARAKPFPPRKAARLLAAIAHAVHHAHQHGILHRDLKPGNILLGANGEPFVSDFGLAKWLEGARDLTISHAVLGTPNYLAPEQAAGDSKKLTTAADIYSLGAIFYELLAGRPPFKAESLIELLAVVAQKEPERPTALNRSVPRDLEIICLKCLSKEPGARYATAKVLAIDLDRFLEGRSILARPASTSRQLVHWAKRNPLAATLAGVLLLALVTISIVSPLVALQIARARDRAVAAEKESALKLRDSYIAQARASRRTARAGQRSEALEALRKAASLGPTLEVRNEAIAALALHDLIPDKALPARARTASPLAFDAANNRYAVEGAPGEILLRGIDNGAMLATLPAPNDAAPACFITPFAGDGRFLVVRHFPGDRVRVWDLNALKLVCEFTNRPTGGIHQIFATDAALDPTGHILALGRAGGGVSFHDLLEGGREIATLTSPSAPSCLTYAPDGKRFALIGNKSKTVDVFDIASGKKLFEVTHNAGVIHAAFSPDGHYLASGARDGQIEISDANTGALLHTLRGHRNRVNQVVFHSNSEVLASTAEDSTVRLWDVRHGLPLVHLPSAGAEPVLRFTKDGSKVFIGSYALQPHLYRYVSAPSWKRLRVSVSGAPENSDLFCALDFSPDGSLLLSATRENVRLLDSVTGEEFASYSFDPTALKSVMFDPSGAAFYVSSLASGVTRREFNRDPARPGQWTIGPPIILRDEKTFAIGGIRSDHRVVALTSKMRGEIQLASLDSLDRPFLTISRHPAVWNAGLSPDGQWIITGSDGSSGEKEMLKLWSAQTGKSVRDFEAIGAGGMGVFRPDGKQLAGFGGGGFILLDAPDWKQRVPSPKDFASECDFVAYSPDGKILAGLVGDRIDLIDSASGRELAALEAPDPLDGQGTIVFSPNGERMAVLASDGALSYWDLKSLRRELGELGLDW
jgi:eukaryotic-like serine/threonine-protein kinase